MSGNNIWANADAPSFSLNQVTPTGGNVPVTLADLAAEVQADHATLLGTVAATPGNRNRLKNGAMLVTQRSLPINVAAGTSVYTLDQWIVASTGAIIAVSQQVGALASYDAYLRLAPAAGTTAVKLQSKLESLDCKDCITGTNLTISGYYRASNLAVGLPSLSLLSPATPDAWGGSLNTVATSTAVLTGAAALAANTWQFFSATFVLGADASAGLMLQFSWPTGAPTYTIDLTNLQFEVGASYTKFEYKDYSSYLRNCQRYYQTGTYDFWTYCIAGAYALDTIGLPTTMRAQPTVVLTATDVSANTTVTVTTFGSSFSQVAIALTTTATGSIRGVGNFTASAEL